MGFLEMPRNGFLGETNKEEQRGTNAADLLK